MPWVPLDTFYADNPKLQAAASSSRLALMVFPFLLAQAKLRADGGRVEITYRDLAHKLFMTTEEARRAIDALSVASVIEMECEAQLSAVVTFPKATWRRWNESFRKQAKREEEAA